MRQRRYLDKVFAMISVEAKHWDFTSGVILVFKEWPISVSDEPGQSNSHLGGGGCFLVWQVGNYNWRQWPETVL